MPVDPRLSSLAIGTGDPLAQITQELADIRRRLDAIDRAGYGLAAADTHFFVLTLLNGWVNAGDPSAPPACYIDGDGRVFLRGMVSHSSLPAGSKVICNLPATPVNYRPPFGGNFFSGNSFQNTSVHVLIVEAGGNITPAGGTVGNTYTHSLDSVSFRTIN